MAVSVCVIGVCVVCGVGELWKDGEIRKALCLKLYTVSHMLQQHIVGGELQHH